MSRYFSKLYCTRPVWQESFSASNRIGPRTSRLRNAWPPHLFAWTGSHPPLPLQHKLFVLPKKWRESSIKLIRKVHITIYVGVGVCVQERWCANVLGLNPFLGIETSHASSYFKAWTYLMVIETLVPQRWPHNHATRYQSLWWRNVWEEEPHPKLEEDSRMEFETNI